MAVEKRIVSWFSCGITSAVATKMTIDKYKGRFPIVVAYCDTGSEHPDNKRFIKDCEKWFELPITILKSEKFDTIYDVWDSTGWIAGIQGARCSLVLKKLVRGEFEDLETDVQIFGFDAAEEKRAEKFKSNNPEVTVEFPLIDSKITKKECAYLVSKAGIDIPVMYKMGYKNNNCIGCVKGAKGYWNKIRVDFPDIFEKTSSYEQKYGTRLNIINIDGKPTRISLKDLSEDAGNYKAEDIIQCGLFCGEL